MDDLLRALLIGGALTLVVAAMLTIFGCAAYQDSAAERGYDTAGIFKRLERQSP